MATRKKTAKTAKKPKKKPPTFFDRGDVEDHISRLLDAQKLVPDEYRGTDEFLDVVSWNIRWFDHKDPKRVAAILKVLDTINADVFVLVEIADKLVVGDWNAAPGMEEWEPLRELDERGDIEFKDINPAALMSEIVNSWVRA